jgi:hypothetical protein
MPADIPLTPPRGLTPREVGRLLRVSPDRIRQWIVSGELLALNMARHRCGKPRFVVMPEHLAEFTRRRRVSPPPRPAKRRKKTMAVDYYPD